MENYRGCLGGCSEFRLYLEGQDDLVGRLIRGINRLTIGVIGLTYLLSKSP